MKKIYSDRLRNVAKAMLILLSGGGFHRVPSNTLTARDAEELARHCRGTHNDVIVERNVA